MRMLSYNMNFWLFSKSFLSINLQINHTKKPQLKIINFLLEKIRIFHSFIDQRTVCSYVTLWVRHEYSFKSASAVPSSRNTGLRIYIGLLHIRWEFSDDWTEFNHSFFLHSWFLVTVNLFLSVPKLLSIPSKNCF